VIGRWYTFHTALPDVSTIPKHRVHKMTICPQHFHVIALEHSLDNGTFVHFKTVDRPFWVVCVRFRIMLQLVEAQFLKSQMV